MRKAGAINYKSYCKNIIKLTNKPVSFEVFADDEKYDNSRSENQ